MKRMFQLGHRPGLDTLRGVAVVLVVVAHLHVPGFAGGGQTGVVMFFVLSGFLITRLLIEERARTGSVSLTGFYRRRAVRLLPALFVFLTVAVGLGWATVGQSIPVVGYYGNLVRAWAGTNLGLLSHSWSLAIEEQFYLAWPVALLVLKRPQRILIAVVAVAWTLRIVAVDQVVHFDTLARGDAIALGCLAALYIDTWRPSRWAFPVGLAAGVLAVTDLFGFRWTVTLAAAAGVMLLAGSLDADRVRLGWFGKRSYGLYLWHFPLVVLYGWWGLPVALAATELSWRLVEQPAQRWRRSKDDDSESGACHEISSRVENQLDTVDGRRVLPQAR